MRKLEITACTVLNPSKATQSIETLYFEDEVFIGKASDKIVFSPNEKLPGDKLMLVPAFIDLSANVIKKEGLKETSALEKAAKAGFQIVCQWPSLALDFCNRFVIKALRQDDQAGQVRLLPIASLTQGLKGETLADMTLLQAAGAVGVSQGDVPIKNTRILYNALAYAASFHLTVFVKIKEPYLDASPAISEGIASTYLGITGNPGVAEEIEIYRILTLAEATGAKVHFSGVSTKKGLMLIKQAKELKMPVTCDVAIANLFLTELDVLPFNTLCLLNPPLRTLEDQQALLQGIKEGVIDAISSGHEEISPEDKQASLVGSKVGYDAFPTFLPLIFSLPEKLNMSLMDVLKLVTVNPLRILGLPMDPFMNNFLLVEKECAWQLNAHDKILSPFQHWLFSAKLQLNLYA